MCEMKLSIALWWAGAQLEWAYQVKRLSLGEALYSKEESYYAVWLSQRDRRTLRH